MSERMPLLWSGTLLQSHKIMIYSVTLVACLLSASFTVFSLYTTKFTEHLGYTPVQINGIAITAEIGLYVPVPLLGHLADTYRLSYLGGAGGVLYLVAYLSAAFVFSSQGSYVLMAGAFFLVGVATSAVFICLFVNCSRLYPKSAFLAISAPTTCHGISSMLFSQLISAFERRHVALNDCFSILAVGLFAVGVVAFVAPIISQTDKLPDYPPPSAEADDFAHVHVSHMRRFVGKPDTWLLLATFVCTSGPLEVYLNNLATIGSNITPPPSISTQVSVFSGFSTLARLLVGAWLDLQRSRFRPTLLLSVVISTLLVSHCLLADHLYGPIPFAVSSAINGFAYGVVFTVYPIIVSRVWGYEGFATYWGMFISGPAVGTLFYGLIFAYDFQRYHSYSLMFWTSSCGLLTSLLVIYRLRVSWGAARELIRPS